MDAQESGEPTLESLFTRFRTHRDLAALAALFDRVAPEMLLVSRHIAPAAGEAEDLVQQTFVTAIERADRWDESRDVLPWMLGILVRHARKGARQASRRVEPDRLTERVVEEPLAAAERVELRAAVVSAVRTLPDRYARALELHLVDELAPREIATRLQIEPGTVRVHLHRGLRLLRETLAPGFAGMGALTTAPASHASLASVREAVLAKGAGVPVGAAAGVAAGLAWKWLMLLFVAFAVIGTNAYVAFAPEPRIEVAQLADPATAPVASEAVVASASAPLAEPPAAAARTPIEQTAPKPAASQTASTIQGRLVRADGSPVAGAKLEFHRRTGISMEEPDTRSEATWKDPAPLETGADGRFVYTFEGARGYGFNLRVNAAGCATAQWDMIPGGPGVTTDLEDAVLETACTLRVRAVDAEKKALTGFSITAQGLKAPDGPFRAKPYFLPKLDEATSEYVYASVAAGRIALDVRHSLTRWTREYTVEVVPDESTRFEIAYDGPSIADRIAVDTRFQSNPGLDIPAEHVTLRREGMEPLQGQRGPSANGGPSMFEPFVFAGLKPGEYTLEIDDPRFVRVVKTGLKPGGERVRIRLEGSAAIRFTITDPTSGEAIHDYALAFVFNEGRTLPQRYDLRKAGAPEPADGLYASLLPGTWKLAVTLPGTQERLVELVDLRPGETRVVKVVNSERPAVRGRVLAADGKTPLAGLLVTMTAGDRVGTTRNGTFVTPASPNAVPPIDVKTKTAADGRFELTLTKPGQQAVRVEFGNWHVADVVVAEDKLSESLTIVEGATGWLEGTIRTAPGSAFEGYRVQIEPLSGPRWFPVMVNDMLGFAIAKDGAFRIGPIDPVEIRVCLLATHAGQIGDWGVPLSNLFAERYVIEAGKTTTASIDLSKTMPARIRLSIAVDGVPLDRGTACGIPVDQHKPTDMASIEIARDGTTLLSGLRPTSTRLVVMPLDRSWAWTDPETLALAPGAELAREVKIELVERTLELHDRGSAAPFANAKVVLVSGSGFAKGEAKPTTDAQGRVVLKLPAGDYALTVDGGTVATPVHWSAEMQPVTSLRL